MLKAGAGFTWVDADKENIVSISFEPDHATNSIGDDCCAVGQAEDEDCCAVPEAISESEGPALCPACRFRGRRIDLITPKSLLVPGALARLVPNETYYFCSQPSCPMVYFRDNCRFRVNDLKVPVFQKDLGDEVPVCYCFAWTRRRIAEEIARTGESSAVQQITEHVQAGRCACEVNNPQGSCCLGNVTQVAAVAKQADYGSQGTGEIVRGE